jgi:hypothetical protein
VKIRSTKLTTPRVADDGSYVALEFLDRSGAPVTVEFPLDQAEAIVMTLPHLLARALKRQTDDEDARYVFNLEGWRIEGAKSQPCLIATLIAISGFEVCFAIPFEACHALSWNLRHSANEAIDAAGFLDEPVGAPGIKLNS